MDLREQVTTLYCKWCSKDCKKNLDCQAAQGFYNDFLAQLQPWCRVCGGTGKVDEVGGGGDDPVISRVSCPSCKGTGKQVTPERISDEEIAKACGCAKIHADAELRKVADAQYSLAQVILTAIVENYEVRLAGEGEKLSSALDLKIKYLMEKHRLEAEIERLKAANSQGRSEAECGRM